MAPNLTTGSINKILKGEDVQKPVIQILGIKKCPGNVGAGERDRYRLLISDGVTGYSFATVGTQFHQMVETKQLENFAVIRVEKYNCKEVEPDCKVIFLWNLTVLVPGREMNEKLGNPIHFTPVSSTINPSENGISGTVHTSPQSLFQPNQNLTRENWTEPGTISDTEMVNFLNLESYTMVPSLTTGSINKILKGEDVQKPVIQILGCRKLPGGERGNDRYLLLISDGVTSHTLAPLGTQLNQMVETKQLENFAVIRVEKYVCKEVKPDCKVIFLWNLTVLVPGSEMNETIGNPMPSNAVSSTEKPSENLSSVIPHQINL